MQPTDKRTTNSPQSRRNNGLQGRVSLILNRFRLVFAHLAAPDAPHIDQRSGRDHHPAHANRSAHRELLSTKRMFDRAHRGFDRAAQIASTGFDATWVGAAMSDVDLLLVEAQDAIPGLAFERLSRPLRQRRTVRTGHSAKTGGEASGRAGGQDCGVLTAGAAHPLGQAGLVARENEIGHAHPVVIGLLAAYRGLKVLDWAVVEGGIDGRAVVAAIGCF